MNHNRDILQFVLFVLIPAGIIGIFVPFALPETEEVGNEYTPATAIHSPKDTPFALPTLRGNTHSRSLFHKPYYGGASARYTIAPDAGLRYGATSSVATSRGLYTTSASTVHSYGGGVATIPPPIYTSNRAQNEEKQAYQGIYTSATPTIRTNSTIPSLREATASAQGTDVSAVMAMPQRYGSGVLLSYTPSWENPYTSSQSAGAWASTGQQQGRDRRNAGSIEDAWYRSLLEYFANNEQYGGGNANLSEADLWNIYNGLPDDGDFSKPTFEDFKALFISISNEHYGDGTWNWKLPMGDGTWTLLALCGLLLLYYVVRARRRTQAD